MHLLSSHIRLPSRRQVRLFWQSFLITALFIGFLSGFFYVAYHGDSVQEPALSVVLPSSIDGIVTGCILAIGRIVGESAALLFTAGFGLVLNGFVESLQSSSATLTVALYVYASERGETAVAFAIATILMVLTFIINFAANLAAKKLKKV